ncbi:MAG: tRNA lysidine(34) synthetase TilS [Rhizobiaceae bacterium]|nr:tRNA lysidine(34) synthetase TilS [Rhizobiaceae bacterium]
MIDFTKATDIVGPDPRVLFADISAVEKVIVAVSGGSDSVALLLLANAWAHHENVQVQAVTVDHGLRPEAAAEAAFVASICEGLGIHHITLAWEGIKPNSGLPEASRLARYQLLEEYAVDSDAKYILTGHTADDQVETVYMRLAREKPTGTGRGLSGMSERTIMPKGVLLMRPLLGLSRNVLRQYLAQNAQSWVEDPSNVDVSYERVRARQFLETRPQHKKDLFAFSKIMGRLRKQIANQTAEFLGDNVSVLPGLVYKLDVASFDKTPQPVLINALQVLLAVAGGGEYFASASKIHPLIDMAMEGAEQASRQTLANCVLEFKAGNIVMYREARNLASFLLGPGDEALWDGRMHLTNDSNTTLYVGPLDPALLAETDIEGVSEDNEIVTVLPRAAIQSLPVLRGDGDDLHFPMLFNKALPEGVSARLTARALAQFCPDFDEALFEWLDDLGKLVKISALVPNSR